MKRHTAKQHKHSVSLWELFFTFFKVGAFTFGGGYAMIAVLEEELVNKKKWITSQDMLDMVVIAESTPGVIAVNSATSIGYRVRGILGAILATLGVVLPSFLIIFALSFAIQAFQENTWYKAAFTGIQACVTILIVNAFIKMSKNLNRDIFTAVLTAAAFAVSVFTKFNVIFLIIIGGVLGIAYSLILQVVADKKNLPLVPAENEDAVSGEDGGLCGDEQSADAGNSFAEKANDGEQGAETPNAASGETVEKPQSSQVEDISDGASPSDGAQIADCAQNSDGDSSPKTTSKKKGAPKQSEEDKK